MRGLIHSSDRQKGEPGLVACVAGLWFILAMANNPERDCSTCKYGDNGSTPEGCPETCLEPELPDYDPIPPNHSREDQLEHRLRFLEQQNEALKQDNRLLRNLCNLASQRIRFALEAFSPRPPFRDTSVTKDRQGSHDRRPKKAIVLPPIKKKSPINHPSAEPLGEAPKRPSLPR